MSARTQLVVAADALDDAIERLASTLSQDLDLDRPSRAIGTSRRDVVVALLGHLDRTNAAMDPRRTRDGRAPADPPEARRVASGPSAEAARAIGARRNRLAETFELALEHVEGAVGRLEVDDERVVDIADELDALLARVELAHVSLGVGYDLLDLPPISVAACRRVSDAFERTRLPGEPRMQPVARRRRGMSSPPGRGRS